MRLKRLPRTAALLERRRAAAGLRWRRCAVRVPDELALLVPNVALLGRPRPADYEERKAALIRILKGEPCD